MIKGSAQNINPSFSPNFHMTKAQEHFTGTDTEKTSANNSTNNTASHYQLRYKTDFFDSKTILLISSV